MAPDDLDERSTSNDESMSDAMVGGGSTVVVRAVAGRFEKLEILHLIMPQKSQLLSNSSRRPDEASTIALRHSIEEVLDLRNGHPWSTMVCASGRKAVAENCQ
jgi:hypothetical protein